jgi:hypothetical protein
MPQFRLYCLDGIGNIDLAKSFEAADDEDATLKARELKRGAHKCEVWQESRLVAALNARDLTG